MWTWVGGDALGEVAGPIGEEPIEVVTLSFGGSRRSHGTIGYITREDEHHGRGPQIRGARAAAS